MEPKKEVLKYSASFSRRKFLKYPLIFGAGLLVGKLTSPCPIIAVNECPPEPAPTVTKTDLSPRFGLNIPNDESFDPSQIAQSGAGWVRFVAMQEDKMKPDKTLEYLDKCRKTGIKTLAVVASESLGNKGLKDAARYFAQTYDGAIDAWQIGNEPDDINPEGKWSWKMDPSSFANLLWMFRDAMGPNAYLVCGGLDTNRLEYLQAVGYEGLQWINAVAIHPYGQGLPDWPSPYGLPGHVGLMVDKYYKYVAIYGKKIWITEWGIHHGHFGSDFAAEYIRRMLTYFRDAEEMRSKVEKIFYYNLSDRQNPEFSLINPDGTKRPSYFAFKDTVTGGKPTAFWQGNFPVPSNLSPFPRQ